MDLWVVAAATGAGYIAKNLQNISSVNKKESLVEPSLKYSTNVRNILHRLRDKNHLLDSLGGKRILDDVFVEVENHIDVSSRDFCRLSVGNEASAASSSGDAFEKNDVHEDYSQGFNFNLPSVLSAEESLGINGGENRKFGRDNRGKVRKKSGGYPIRLLSSVGRSHGAQLCKGQEKKDETLSSLVPSMSAVRPVLVFDGSRIISRSNSDPSVIRFEGCSEEARRDNCGVFKANNSVLETASLKLSDSVDELKRSAEMGPGNLKLSDSCDGSSDRSFGPQGPNGMLLFITGMTIGILSATIAGKSEADELDKQLKNMENLVQDLHEELDMKQSLTVEELINEGDLRPGESDTREPIASPANVEVNNLSKFDSLNANQGITENTDLLSKIEAELEAELAVLEQNIKRSAVDRISDVVELDPDIEVEIVRGNLEPAMANRCGTASESRSETTSDTTPYCSQPANYAICPWELSLRLYQLIESRLEERIKELETALAHCGNSAQFIGPQSIAIERRFSYSGTESPFTQQTPTFICEHNDKEDEPPPEKFASNNLDSYEKKHNAISLNVRIGNQEREDEESSCRGTVDQSSSPERNVYGQCDSTSHRSVIMEEEFIQEMQQIWDEHSWMSFMSNDDSRSEDADGIDESEMLLVKQIIERKKSGSNVVLTF